TRNGTGASGPVPANGTIKLQVTGQGGVPTTGVGAVAINMTDTQPTAPGAATVWPDGITRPNTSNLNFVAGETIPNLVVVPVGSDGKIDVFNGGTGTSQYVGDVFCFFASGSPAPGALSFLSPALFRSTRNGTGASGPVPANGT